MEDLKSNEQSVRKQEQEEDTGLLVEVVEAAEVDERAASPAAPANDSNRTDPSTTSYATTSNDNIDTCNDDDSGGKQVTPEPALSADSETRLQQVDSPSCSVALAEKLSKANVAEASCSPQPRHESNNQRSSPVPMRSQRPRTAPMGGRRRRRKDLSLVPIKTDGRKSRSRPNSASSSPATSPHGGRPLSPHFGTAKRNAYLKLSSSTAEPVPSTYATMADGRAPCPTKYSKLSNRDIEDPATPAGPITAGRHQVFGHSIHAQRDLSIPDSSLYATHTTWSNSNRSTSPAFTTGRRGPTKQYIPGVNQIVARPKSPGPGRYSIPSGMSKRTTSMAVGTYEENKRKRERWKRINAQLKEIGKPIQRKRSPRSYATESVNSRFRNAPGVTFSSSRRLPVTHQRLDENTIASGEKVPGPPGGAQVAFNSVGKQARPSCPSTKFGSGERFRTHLDPYVSSLRAT